jgi:DNA-directed RNA polymerase specialized sigma24 family protein
MSEPLTLIRVAYYHRREISPMAKADSASDQTEVLLLSVKGDVRDAIQRTLGAHFHSQTGAVRENIEDLTSEAMLLLTRKLREHGDAASELIQNFRAYAVTVASNVCHSYLRRRYPAWTRLKNQIRYVATHDPQLELRAQNGVSFCVLKQDVLRVAPDADLRQLPLPDLVKATIQQAGRLLELNELVRAIAEIQGIHDGGPAAAKTDVLHDPGDARAAAGPEEISFLRKVWEQVQQLPMRQRIALLLNLRDGQGHGMLPLFPITGTASMDQIAAVIGIGADELAALWNRLPVEDSQIARRLGITRQQVINLRKAARARLSRRLAGESF